MDPRGEEDPRREAPPRGRGRASRTSPLLPLLLAALILALPAVVAVPLWRSLGDSISGTSVAKGSIGPAGPKPRLRLTNAAGRVSGRFSGSGRVPVKTGDITAKLPAEDTRDRALQTRVGSVLREPPGEGSDGRGPEKRKQGQ